MRRGWELWGTSPLEGGRRELAQERTRKGPRAAPAQEPALRLLWPPSTAKHKLDEFIEKIPILTQSSAIFYKFDSCKKPVWILLGVVVILLIYKCACHIQLKHNTEKPLLLFEHFLCSSAAPQGCFLASFLLRPKADLRVLASPFPSGLFPSHVVAPPTCQTLQAVFNVRELAVASFLLAPCLNLVLVRELRVPKNQIEVNCVLR